MMARQPRIAIIWAQFSAYHVDRLEAVGARLAGRAEVLAVEVCARSRVYAWEPSQEVRNTRKVRLFDDRTFEDIPVLARWWAMLKATWRCDAVFLGVGYNEPDALLLGLTLRLLGVRVIVMSASKWDDRSRGSAFELCKSLLLLPFSAALVGGRRQRDYLRFLGFRRRPVRVGYNTVDSERIREQARVAGGGFDQAFADRPFVFVGRFVRKKLLERTLAAYAGYVRRTPGLPHRLTLIGSGEREPLLRGRAEELGIAHLVDWPGFLAAPQVAASLAASLALVLVSEEEQWGLVVNEALAVGLPVIVSAQIGAREALVRNLENGFVIEPGSIEGLTEAMLAIASSEARWKEFSAAALARAWIGDSQRFADAVELDTFPESPSALRAYAEFARAIGVGEQADGRNA
jgi:glycosyltransferase involved in cell wall biosynthesis